MAHKKGGNWGAALTKGPDSIARKQSRWRKVVDLLGSNGPMTTSAIAAAMETLPHTIPTLLNTSSWFEKTGDGFWRLSPGGEDEYKRMIAK